jgi:hypothetical protein
MKYTLPTLRVLSFGIRAKMGKLDSAGMRKAASSNIGGILNQVTMMLGYQVFDTADERLSYEVRPGWTLQPNAQYIWHPGGGATVPPSSIRGKLLEDAAVFGFRTAVRF